MTSENSSSSIKPSISFEFFPPKTEETEEKMLKAVQDLDRLNPKYMTVTFGAGGSTRDGTYDILKKATDLVDTPFGSHLTFLCLTEEELKDYTDRLWQMGVKHIVALRGDIPKSWEESDEEPPRAFPYTSDFVEALKTWHDFEISVGAYPEKHPDAPDLSADVEALRKKCAAGATRAITQFFFDNRIYYDFLEEVEKTGIKTPVYPGILPIFDIKSVKRFAKMCEASIPVKILEKYNGMEEKPEEMEKIAEDIILGQVQDLIDHGVQHIHFYSMNRGEMLVRACKALGLAA